MKISDGDAATVEIRRTSRWDKLLTHFCVFHNLETGYDVAFGEASHVSQLEDDTWSAITYNWWKRGAGKPYDRDYVRVKSQIIKLPSRSLVKKEDYDGPFSDDEEHLAEDQYSDDADDTDDTLNEKLDEG